MKLRHWHLQGINKLDGLGCFVFSKVFVDISIAIFGKYKTKGEEDMQY